MRLTVGYHGTRYAGWASQRGKVTVQSTLEAALTRSLAHPVSVTGAGRTDAGVHAEAQVVSFDTSAPLPPHGLTKVLRRHLPPDVWVVDAAEAPKSFDARKSAIRRWYRYAIWRHATPPAAWQGRCLVSTEPLDIDAMRDASRALLGTRDLATLATTPPPGRSTVRTVLAADWLSTASSPLLVFEVCANAFLKQMVRAIVGGLLWVGRGRWTPGRFASSLASADRRAGGPNAPAVGLTLSRIEYP